jgi:hypothetical protein
MVYHRVHLWDGARDISEDGYFIPVSGRVPENRSALLRYPMVGTSCLAFREALWKLLPVPETLRFRAGMFSIGDVMANNDKQDGEAPQTVELGNSTLENWRTRRGFVFFSTQNSGAHRLLNPAWIKKFPCTS